MLYPALAIFSMVACSRLPFGKPSLRTGLCFFMRVTGLPAPSAAAANSFLLFSHLAEANALPAGNSIHPPAGRPSTLHLNFSAQQRRNRRRVQNAFGLLNPFVQRGWRVVVQHRNGLLSEDGPGVDALVDKVNGATGHLDAVIERLFPRFQTRKRGQQSRMNVDHPFGKRTEKIAFQYPHE